MTPDRAELIELGAFAGAFAAFSVAVGHLLRTRGRVFLNHTFETHPGVAASVHFLLDLGFYLLCTSLFLWNLGVSAVGQDPTLIDLLQSVSVRLGVSIFAVAAFHSLNVLILSVLNRNHPRATG